MLTITFFTLSATHPLAAQNGLKASKSTVEKTVSDETTSLVNWSPWTAATFDKSRATNQLVMVFVSDRNSTLSLKMQRETFQNFGVADILNQSFLSIQVDAAESPELARFLLANLQACQVRNGVESAFQVPVVLLLTPDQSPITGGQYFTAKDLDHQPGLISLLEETKAKWETQKAETQATAKAVSEEVAKNFDFRMPSQPEQLKPNHLLSARNRIEESLFKSPTETTGNVDPLLSILAIQNLLSSLGVSGTSGQEELDVFLTRFSMSGVQDHLTGGFFSTIHESSKERSYQKSLARNCLVSLVMLDAYQRTGRESYRRQAESVLDFILTEFLNQDGGAGEAISAENQSNQDGYYLWTSRELTQILTPGEQRLAAATYGLNLSAPGDQRQSLALNKPLDEVAEELSVPLLEYRVRLKNVQTKLLQQRARRPDLKRDHRVLTSSNGLLIRTFADASKILKRRDFLDAAEKNALLILNQHRDSQGKLLHLVTQKQSGIPATLDDYAFLISGLLSLYETTLEQKWLSAAKRLTEDQISLFWDADNFGFFETSTARTTTSLRLKCCHDTFLPSGNSVSIQNLIRLARTQTGENARIYAMKAVQVFHSALLSQPENCPTLVSAGQEYLYWFGNLEDRAGATGGLFAGGPSSPRERIVKEETQSQQPESDDSFQMKSLFSDTDAVQKSEMQSSTDQADSISGDSSDSAKSESMEDASKENPASGISADTLAVASSSDSDNSKSNGMPLGSGTFAVPADLITEPNIGMENNGSETPSDINSQQSMSPLSGLDSFPKPDSFSGTSEAQTPSDTTGPDAGSLPVSPRGPVENANPSKMNSVAPESSTNSVETVPLPGVLSASPEEILKHPNINVVGYLSTKELAAGRSCGLAVLIELDNDWSVIGFDEPHPKLKPLSFEITSPQGVKVSEIHYQPSTVIDLAGYQLKSSQKQTVGIIAISLPDDLVGEQELKLKIRYQFFKDRDLLPEAEYVISAKMNVVSTNESPQPVNLEEMKEVIEIIQLERQKQAASNP